VKCTWRDIGEDDTGCADGAEEEEGRRAVRVSAELLAEPDEGEATARQRRGATHPLATEHADVTGVI